MRKKQPKFFAFLLLLKFFAFLLLQFFAFCFEATQTTRRGELFSSPARGHTNNNNNPIER